MIAQSKVQDRRLNNLFLSQQAGSDLYLPSNSERINPLISHHSGRSRANDLPPIILRAVIDQFSGRVTVRQAQDIQSPIFIQIRH